MNKGTKGFWLVVSRADGSRLPTARTVRLTVSPREHSNDSQPEKARKRTGLSPRQEMPPRRSTPTLPSQGKSALGFGWAKVAGGTTSGGPSRDLFVGKTLAFPVPPAGNTPAVMDPSVAG